MPQGHNILLRVEIFKIFWNGLWWLIYALLSKRADFFAWSLFYIITQEKSGFEQLLKKYIDEMLLFS